MKTKQKLVLAIASLSAVCAGVAATSTFAWFTTNKQTTVSYTNVTAQGTRGNLDVSIQKIGELDKKTPDTDTATAITSTSTVSDISSVDGLQFYQPSWASTAGNNQKVNAVNNVTEKRGSYYCSFVVTLKNTAAGNLNVFIDNNTLISPNTTTSYDASHTKENAVQGDRDVRLASWSRMVIANSTAADMDTLITNLPKAGDSTSIFTKKVMIAGSSDGGQGIASTTLTSENKATFSAVTPTYKQTFDSTGTQATSVPAVNDSSVDTAANFIVKIGAGETKYCLVTIWLEGSSADDQDICKAGVINANIGFTAIDA